MHRLTRPFIVASLGGLMVTSLAVTVGPDSNASAQAADERARPTTAKTYFAASDTDPRDYWTNDRRAAAKPLLNTRDRTKPRVTVSDEIGNNPPSIAGVDVPDEKSGGVVKPAADQPTLTYPFPFGRRSVLSQRR